MSYIFSKDVTIGGLFGSDMFGRLKIAEPFTLFDSAHRYQDNGEFSDEISGTASATHLPNESSIALTVGSTNGDSITRESRKVFPYQPGKSLQVLQTFVMDEPEANLVQRVGYFSRQNGIYLEQDGTDISIVRRSYVNGSVVNTKIAQENWNVDTLDGNGTSGVTLDLTKAQIMFMEFEWLGVGSVRVGFAVDGVFHIAHQFNHSNILESVYMTTASLPVRYEIFNSGSTSGNNTLKQICVTVISNGGYLPSKQEKIAERNTAPSVGTSFYPLVAIRMASGRTDSVIIPSAFSVFPTAAGDYEWAIFKNSTLTGGTWTAHSSNNVEYNVTATAMSDGTKIKNGFFTADNKLGSPISLGDIQNFSLQLGRTNASTPTSDVLILACRTLSSTGGAIGGLSWTDVL